MRFKLRPYDFFIGVFFTSCIIFMCISAVYGIHKVVENRKNIMTDPSQQMYIYDLSDEYNLGSCTNDKVFITSSNTYSDVFIIENAGYTFPNIENYEVYQKMTSPLSMFAESSLVGKEIDYVELFDAFIKEKNWEDIGVYDESLKGRIRIKIFYNNDNEYEIIKCYLRQVYPYHYEELIKNCYKGYEFRSDYIHLGFTYSFPQEDYVKEVTTNLPLAEAQCILYKINNEEYKDFHINEIFGFKFVEEFENNNAINVWKGLEKISVNIQEEIIQEPTQTQENTTDEIFEEEITGDEEVIESVFQHPLIKFMMTMLIFSITSLFIAIGLKAMLG